MNKVLCFILGVAAGSGAAYYLTKKYYYKIHKEEIDELRGYYGGLLFQDDKNVDNDKNEVIEEKDEPTQYVDDSKESYNKIVYSQKYNNIPNEDKEIIDDIFNSDPDDVIIKKEDGSMYMGLDDKNIKKFSEICYKIPPEEFGDIGYARRYITMYKDDVLVDESNEIIDDPELLLGDFKSGIGEYEDGIVHIRNEETETDYEIVIDLSTYNEAYNINEEE